jgi:GT2 family glycosyltransferase
MAGDLAIIIPNWNGAECIDACLQSILDSGDGVTGRVIVVDNGSTDDSLQHLEAWEGRLPVEVVALAENIGYGPANNVGFERVVEEYCLFLNNDAVIESPLRSATEYLDAHRLVGIAQGMQLSEDGGTIDSVGSLLTSLGFLVHPLRGATPAEAPDEMPVFTVKGAAMFARTACVRGIGGFDPTAFAYWEEADLCWRARVAGWEISFSRRLPSIRHVGGLTSRRLGSSFREFQSYKNRLRSILKNAGGVTLAVMLPLHTACCLAAAVAATLMGRPRGAVNIVRALLWNVRVLPDTLRERRRITRLRHRPDRDALRGVTQRVGVADLVGGLRLYGRWYHPDIDGNENSEAPAALR